MKRCTFPAIAILLAACHSASAAHVHYFHWTDKPNEVRLKDCVAAMKRVLDAAPQLVAGPNREGPPIVELMKIEFNGRGDDGVQPFSFPGTSGMNACKTQLKPYDAVVTACLLVARDYFTPAELRIDSSGSWDDGDWADGAKLYARVFQRQATNPLNVAEEDEPPPDFPPPGMPQPEGWTPLSIGVVGGIGIALVWWLVRPHFAFVIEIERNRIERTRGDAERPFLMEVDDICREYQIRHGWVRAIQVQGWTKLTFSGDIPPDCRQRIRNTWYAHREK